MPFGLGIGLPGLGPVGAPLERRGYFNGGTGFGYDIQLVPKGYEGRQATNWDANLTLAYPLRIGPVTVTLQAFVYNLFNNQFPTSQNVLWSSQAPADYPESIFDPNQEQNNPDYGKVTTRQDPRLFRAAVRITF